MQKAADVDITGSQLGFKLVTTSARIVVLRRGHVLRANGEPSLSRYRFHVWRRSYRMDLSFCVSHLRHDELKAILHGDVQ